MTYELVDALYDTVYDQVPGILSLAVTAEGIAGDAQVLYQTKLGEYGIFGPPDSRMVDLAQDEMDRILTGDLSGIFEEGEQ